MKRPAFQFYPGDWRKDVELRSCSIAARGLWIDLMCVMHDCDPYGHLVLNGKPMTTPQISGQIGLPPLQLNRLLDELLCNGVARKDDRGAIFSKRMVADERVRTARAEGGKAGSEHGIKGAEHGVKGGRPVTSKGGSETPLHDAGEPPPSSSSSSSTRAEEANASSSSKPTVVPCPYDQIIEAYHEALPTLPRVLLKSPSRQKAIRGFWGWVLSSKKSDGTPRATNADEAMAWIHSYFVRANDNDFLMGRTAKSDGHENWTCDFDFLLTERGKKQIIEKTRAAA